MNAHWRCFDCDMTGEGTWAQVDKSAEKHTKDARHGTTTKTIGSTRTRDAAGAVRNTREAS